MAQKQEEKENENDCDECLENNNNPKESEYMKDVIKVLYSKEQISKRIKELGAEISKDYQNKPLIVVGLLKGAFMVTADLVREITLPHKVDFMILSSYHGKQSTTVKVKQDMSIDPSNSHILIVEDLIDTGATLTWLQNHLKSKDALSVEIVTLLDKSVQRKKENQIFIKYVGFKCENDWVIGYGMDYNQHYRSLDCVGILNPKVYQDSL